MDRLFRAGAGDAGSGFGRLATAESSGRRRYVVAQRGAWSVFWIGSALLFNVGIYVWRGTEPALQFFTAYLVEKALSVDNLFVFVLIFSMFGVPVRHQRRVLFWGVIGALVMRGVFIA